MEKKGETKRQHYVPQFILRGFSRDAKNTSVLIMKNGRVVSSGPLSRQCYEDYFYGEDQIMERSFARHERQIAAMLGDLARERLESLSDEDVCQLKLFVHYQMHRTPAAVEQNAEFVGAFVRRSAFSTARLNGDELDEEALESVRLVDPNGVNNALWLAAKSTPVVHDLHLRFLVRESGPGFVIADHPVVSCNQFAENHRLLSRRPNITAPVATGIQILMPLSSSVAVVLYDPSAYAFDVSRRVCNVGPRDVLAINKAQAVNSFGCVFYDATRTNEATIAAMFDARKKHPNVHRNQVLSTPVIDDGTGKPRQVIAVFKNEVRVGARFSFLRVTNQRDYRNYEGAGAPPRSEELLVFLKFYGECCERISEARRELEAGAELDEATLREVAVAVARDWRASGELTGASRRSEKTT
jgi:hypothetical protein